ncbi:uncharacterized protein LOC108743837 [Agrilus planipennis]|uniref:Uncharacterized protein LOC108743837 n=1 Tax=Agrilus planipennis TaxID=224129 RepID=A0A7F5QVA5_AGRPL|nr:uncharacterized protein LOC112904045 [Agrilus planipennis]XP_025835415.1 uncharacterized protein LOC108743837 [Agrilus planipennis]
MAGFFIGVWEISEYSEIRTSQNECLSIKGVTFKLDDSGDVTWTVPEELNPVPLFSCETFEVHKSYDNLILCFGVYSGHIIEFSCEWNEVKDEMTLTCQNWGVLLKCKRIADESIDHFPKFPFSLLPALEDGYFSDMIIVASNKKEFKVHSIVLKLFGKDLSWDTVPIPFSGLPEDVLGTILHFFYAECLPYSVSEATIQKVIDVSKQYPCLSKLVSMCELYLKNMALKGQIISLVNDMHQSINQMIGHFSACHGSTDNITSNASKLCFMVKQSIRDAAVAAVKLLLLCDLFTKRKGELSKEERHEIIQYAKSRLPIFMSQLQNFLHIVKSTFNGMTSTQRHEIAAYIVPEVEVILDTISSVVVEIEKALQQILQVISPQDEPKKRSGVDLLLLGRSLKNVLHIRELNKIKDVYEYVTFGISLLLHKKETFKELSQSQKVRSVARNLEQVFEELPFFLLRLEEISVMLDDKLDWKEFKFCFKVGTSKVAGVLQRLVAHREMMQDVMVQLCDLIQRDAFIQSLQILGLLDNNKESASSDNCQKPLNSPSQTQNSQGCMLNLVESLCVPPPPSESDLSKLAAKLMDDEDSTDMEFKVIVCANAQDVSEKESGVPDQNVCTLKAHRVIVAARCDWFRRALLSGMKEAIDKKIHIYDTNDFLFKIFLEYLYSGRLKQSLSTDQLCELLLLSDRYECDSLKQMCESALETNIDEDSVIYLLSVADQYNANNLKKACLFFIFQHNDLTESEVFYELPVSLQAEVFDCVWTQTPKKNVTGYNYKYCESEPDFADFVNEGTCSRMDNFVAQLRDICGDVVSTDKLVEIALAADFDISRAVNYVFSSTED